jgi:glycosyltransferase involved in cell wall biosynthesis
MKVAIIADPCDPKKPGGLGRCIFELARATVAAGQGHSFTVYSKSDFPVQGVSVKRLPNNVWIQAGRVLPKDFDLYIFFTPVIPLFFKPKRAIVVALDFAYLELPRHTLREKYLAWVTYMMHKRSLKMAEHVVCISEATKQAAIKYFNVAPEKCSIVPLAAMPLKAPVEVPDLPTDFFLFAGILKERKNVANLVRAFALFAQQDPTYSFVIAGGKSGEYFEMLKKLASDLGVGDRVRFVGYMSDGEMAYLYSRAKALVFASLVEGFGMPVAEAFTAGVPVITSNFGALAEVADSAALLVDPRSPSSIAAAMTKLAQDEQLRESLRQKGLVRAKDFSWEESGKKLAALLSK